ncbi:bacterial transcriptional activator domain-containing protein, partial [Saccharothrix algeriensis]
FAQLVGRAEGCDEEQRLALLDEALGLWRGEPLVDLDGVEVDGYRAELSRLQLAVEVQARQIDVRNGRSRKALPRLERAFREQPGDTTITGLYLCALHATGQRGYLASAYDQHEESLGGDYVDGRLKSLYTSIRRGASDLSPHAEFFLGGPPAPESRSPGEDAGEHLDPAPESAPESAPEAAPGHRWNAQNVNYIHSQLTTGTVVFGTNLGG